ncbi:MAG: N-acetylmuramoyl-L-alanine amidase [Flavobacteriaceae bacterium]|nr:MAG: N-acetylmuramoyl-L-alanine amidase [Flavobacteriaceae bacterium]
MSKETPKPTSSSAVSSNSESQYLKPNVEAEVRGYKIDRTLYPSKGKNQRVKTLIMHYTAGDLPTSSMILTTRDVSAHYMVNDLDDKNINILVSEDQRAWHAGVSNWGGKDNLNDTSIGIEIVNMGFTNQGGVQTWYPFPDYQVKKVALLMKDIIERYEIEPTNVIGHSDVAPGRKFDPGPLFPWRELYENYGIGAWYEQSDVTEFMIQFNPELVNSPSFVLETKKEFEKYGYKTNGSSTWDEESKKLITAFQYHFRPSNYNGILDAETWAILKALNKKYKSK